MALDVSGMSYFVPAFSFVLLLVIIYAILNKTKILGEEKAVQWIVASVLSLIFISVSDVRSYVESVTPWFSVLVVALFFVIFLAAFGLGEKDMGKIMKPWFIWIFIAILGVIFILNAYHQFNLASNSDFLGIKNFLKNKEIAGSLWLILFGAIAVFAVARKAKKD